MKKNFLFGLFATAMLLLTTACQKEADLGLNTGEDGLVTINLSTPEMATRAYSDGTMATRLQYAVYDAEGKYLPALTVTDATINLQTKVELQLTTGNEYTLVFWAGAPTAPYTVDFANKKMTVDYPADLVSNREDLDAFYRDTTFTVTGRMSVDLHLYRPFAQLNIGTSDLAESAAAGYDVKEAAVTTRAYKQFNFITRTVDQAEDVTFGLNTLPTEAFPVAGYDYVAMNYILMTNDKGVNPTVTLTYTDGTTPKTRTFTNIPLQRNYRTNIFGQLFTSDVDVNVEIIPAYYEPAYTILDAFENGGIATLTEDILLNQPLVVKSGVEAVLNLNGKTIKNQEANKLTDVIIVEEGAKLTINGEGTIEAVTGNDGYAVISEGELVINGGTYKAGQDADGAANAVVYARGNGKVTVNGGEFPNEYNSTFVLNKRDADRATTVIEVAGGRFYNFDPANNAAEGANTNFLKEGCVSLLEDGNVYVVVSGANVTTVDEFKAAAANAELDYIVVGADLDFGTALVDVNTNKIILGNGYKFIAGGKTTKNYGLRIQAANVTINDLVMNGGGGIYISDNANVVVNNVTLKANYSASGRHMFYVNNAVLTVNSGVFEVLRSGMYYFSMQNNARAYVKGGTWEDMMSKGQQPVYTDGGAKLEISGGKFQVATANYKFDPTAWLAAGYKAERVGNYMEVSAE